MRIDPIIPIWLMLILCVGMAFLKRRKRSAYIRQIADDISHQSEDHGPKQQRGDKCPEA